MGCRGQGTWRSKTPASSPSFGRGQCLQEPHKQFVSGMKLGTTDQGSWSQSAAGRYHQDLTSYPHRHHHQIMMVMLNPRTTNMSSSAAAAARQLHQCRSAHTTLPLLSPPGDEKLVSCPTTTRTAMCPDSATLIRSMSLPLVMT